MKTIKQIKDEKLFDYDQSYKIECGHNAQIDLEEMFNLKGLNDKQLKHLKKSIKAELDQKARSYEEVATNIRVAKHHFTKALVDQIKQNQMERLLSKIENN